jgi:hypothetical protein
MYKLRFNSGERQHSLMLKNVEEVRHIINTSHLVSKVNLWEDGRLLPQQEVFDLVYRIDRQSA